MAAADLPSAGALHRAVDGEGFARLVSAVESLRPGTRLLSDGQQTVLAEYEHIVEQLRPPTFTPPAPEISDFSAEDGKVKIFGKHLRDPISVTIAGVRAGSFEVKQPGKDESPYLEADVPRVVDAGPIVVLTSGGSCTSVRLFRGAEIARSVPLKADEPAPEPPAASDLARPAPPDADKAGSKPRAGRKTTRAATPNADKAASKPRAGRKTTRAAPPNAGKPASNQPARS